ncbi:MFS transporter [Bradyrhizobium sp. 25ACV]
MGYRIDPAKREAHLQAIAGLEQQRRCDGAYAWDLFEDAAVNGRNLEAFKVASWLEHLRQPSA